MKTFIVIICRPFGGDGVPVKMMSYSDLQEFENRHDAISHGFKTIHSDDFNIGVLEDGKLVSFDWMDKPIGEKPEVIEEISNSLGL